MAELGAEIPPVIPLFSQFLKSCETWALVFPPLICWNAAKQ